MKLKAIATLLTLCASAAFADEAYFVSSEIVHENRVLGSPSMLVLANNSASLEAGDSYKLSFIVKPNNEESVLISTNLNIAGNSYNPALLVHLGQEASVSIDDMTLSMTVTRHTQ